MIAREIPGAEIIENVDGDVTVELSCVSGTAARLMRQRNGWWHACMFNLTVEGCVELGRLLAGSAPAMAVAFAESVS